MGTKRALHNGAGCTARMLRYVEENTAPFKASGQAGGNMISKRLKKAEPKIARFYARREGKLRIGVFEGLLRPDDSRQRRKDVYSLYTPTGVWP